MLDIFVLMLQWPARIVIRLAVDQRFCSTFTAVLLYIVAVQRINFYFSTSFENFMMNGPIEIHQNQLL